jgi:uncharacterized repeat protein (TIGR03803 family)
MFSRWFLNRAVSVLIALGSIVPATRAVAQQETVLFNFNIIGDSGVWPTGSLIFDASGNLYGTASAGAGSGSICSGTGCGAVFEMIHGADGWTEKVLHDFNDNPADGADPYGSLIFDAAGNLYGTTRGGGSAGFGTVYKLSPRSDGTWRETILHNFQNSDGNAPYAGLIFDAAGNLYGTTSEGGARGWGNVFELLPQSNGSWKEKILHSFGGTDGWAPQASLLMDSSGNLYGTTAFGGARLVDDYGIVFELLPQTDGTWKEKILANFPELGSGPQEPLANLILDSTGNLYTTSYHGGSNGGGTVFELVPKPNGEWETKILIDFAYAIGGGSYPSSGLIMDAAGNLYGTDSNAGTNNEADGTVFQLKPSRSGDWSETVIHSFINNASDGLNPNGGVIFDSTGNLYGTTVFGGTYTWGTVYEITP